MEELRSSGVEEIKEVFRDRKILISFFIGELGWFLQRYQAHLRYLKREVYKDWDFVIICNKNFHIFVDDFASFTLDLPEWFYNLGLDQDSYEAVLPGSTPGSLTPPAVYQNLLLMMHDFCKYAKKYEIALSPRSCNTIIDSRLQIFCKFIYGEKIESDKPIIVVFPRARTRARHRNVPEYVWDKLVRELIKNFTVVLAGTRSGACLADMYGDDIINLIDYDYDDKTGQVIRYLNNAVCSISSQSGGTHISLLSGTPSYIIGHERQRHTHYENRLEAPTSFRFVTDYRAIDEEVIVADLKQFIKALFDSDWFNKINRPSLRLLENKKGLVGVEIGTDRGLNALNILENLDIEKLYLVDPYTIYRNLTNVGCNLTEEQCISIEKEAHSRLEKYKDKIVWIKDLSENAVKLIPDNLDFAYIDGNHRYEYAKNDIMLYTPKVKDGGLVICHDYDYPDVKKAVDEMFGSSVLVGKCLDNTERLEACYIKPTDSDKIISQDYQKLMEMVSVA